MSGYQCTECGFTYPYRHARCEVCGSYNVLAIGATEKREAPKTTDAAGTDVVRTPDLIGLREDAAAKKLREADTFKRRSPVPHRRFFAFVAFILVTLSIVLLSILAVLDAMSPSLSIVDGGMPQSFSEVRARVVAQWMILRASPVDADSDGRLIHDADDDAVEIQRLGEDEFRDFIVEARFHNPYSRLDGAWDYGFFFRNTGANRQYRLIVMSSQRWTFRHVAGDVNDPVSERSKREGSLENLDISRSGDNHLYLVVSGDHGYFFVNDDYVTTFELSENDGSGDVLVVTGAFSDHAITGETTIFEDLTIYEWSRVGEGNNDNDLPSPTQQPAVIMRLPWRR